MSDEQREASESSWEDEGGAPAPEPKQKTPEGSEIPVPKRKGVLDALRNLVRPKKP